MIEWSYFYDKYSDLSDSKLKSYISLLEDIDAGCELVDVVTDIKNKDIKALLVRKAIQLNVEFDQDDFELLDDEIPSDLYAQLATEGNISFGSSEEVAQVISNLFDEQGKEALYQKALKVGIKFTKKQLEFMDKYEEEEYETQQLEEKSTQCGCLGFLFGLGLLLGGDSNHSDQQSHSGARSSKKRDARQCNGDCASCPPHYGYRYGRWYYGHGHQHGCERGGNGGASGKCYKN